MTGEAEPRRYRAYHYVSASELEINPKWRHIVVHTANTFDFLDAIKTLIGGKNVITFPQDIIYFQDGMSDWNTNGYCCTVFWVPAEHQNRFLKPLQKRAEYEVVLRVMKAYQLEFCNVKDYTYGAITISGILYENVEWATIVVRTYCGVFRLNLGLGVLKREYEDLIKFDIPGRKVAGNEVDGNGLD